MIGGTGENRGLVARVGQVDVDIPRSIGYFGAITLAVAFEVIEWPVGLFIASIPFVKMLNRPKLPQPVHFVEHVLDGAAKPVGGDSEGTIHIANQRSSSEPPSSEASRRGSASSSTGSDRPNGQATQQAPAGTGRTRPATSPRRPVSRRSR